MSSVSAAARRSTVPAMLWPPPLTLSSSAVLARERRPPRRRRAADGRLDDERGTVGPTIPFQSDGASAQALVACAQERAVDAQRRTARVRWRRSRHRPPRATQRAHERLGRLDRRRRCPRSLDHVQRPAVAGARRLRPTESGTIESWRPQIRLVGTAIRAQQPSGIAGKPNCSISAWSAPATLRRRAARSRL